MCVCFFFHPRDLQLVQYFLLLAKVDVNEGGSWNERGKHEAQRRAGWKRGVARGVEAITSWRDQLR